MVWKLETQPLSAITKAKFLQTVDSKHNYIKLQNLLWIQYLYSFISLLYLFNDRFLDDSRKCFCIFHIWEHHTSVHHATKKNSEEKKLYLNSNLTLVLHPSEISTSSIRNIKRWVGQLGMHENMYSVGDQKLQRSNSVGSVRVTLRVKFLINF